MIFCKYQAIETKTAGGIAKKDRKTIYVFQDKQNGRATHKGKDWPIITTYNN